MIPQKKKGLRQDSMVQKGDVLMSCLPLFQQHLWLMSAVSFDVFPLVFKIRIVFLGFTFCNLRQISIQFNYTALTNMQFRFYPCQHFLCSDCYPKVYPSALGSVNHSSIALKSYYFFHTSNLHAVYCFSLVCSHHSLPVLCTVRGILWALHWGLL